MANGATVEGVMDLAEVRPMAWMDRWTVLDFCDQLALFGFAPELRRRTGLSSGVTHENLQGHRQPDRTWNIV